MGSRRFANIIEYYYYYIKYVNRRVIWALFKKNWGVNYGRKVMLAKDGNEILYHLIKNQKPFIAGKFGCTEIGAISEVRKTDLKLGKIRSSDRRTLLINSGFFPNDDEHIKKFAELYLDLMEHIDVLGVWNTRFEDYFVKKYLTNSQLSNSQFLESYYFDKPWSSALKGKKVLVIHPFAETILSQYQKRELLFENKEVLPEFELVTLKATQTIAGNKSEFNTWFDALDCMYEKAMAINFDIALVGCGAYGLPLAVKIKLAGKQAIHTGGATQILFGIKGARWDENPKVARMYNKYWVRPNAKEIPRNSEKVENACYW